MDASESRKGTRREGKRKISFQDADCELDSIETFKSFISSLMSTCGSIGKNSREQTEQMCFEKVTV